MLHVRVLDSFDAPELAPYKNMRQQEDHLGQRIFVAEGEKVVRRLLESSLSVISVLLPEKWLADMQPLLEERSEAIHIFTADRPVLENLTGFSIYQGVLALAKVPEATGVKQILECSAKPYLFAALDGLTNAENMGVIIRNAAAFGVQALVVGETSIHPYMRRAVRGSMGTIFNLPVVETPSLRQTLREFSALGIRTIAAHPHTEGRTLVQADLRQDCCMVFGSEGLGIAPSVLEACDDMFAIPMQSGVDSLNVGSASAAFLYEVNRQRGKV